MPEDEIDLEEIIARALRALGATDLTDALRFIRILPSDNVEINRKILREIIVADLLERTETSEPPHVPYTHR